MWILLSTVDSKAEVVGVIQGFSTGRVCAKSSAFSNAYWHLNALKIKKYLKKRMYLALHHAFYCLIVAQHQNNVKEPWCNILHHFKQQSQWYLIDSGITGGEQGGRVPPQRLLTGKFLLTYRGKKEARKKWKRGENWEEKKENCKREGGKFEMEVGKVIKRGEDLFFFFSSFFGFHFWKRRKLN